MGYSFIDLFCGCGGFSLGMQKAGFRELASIDFDSHATDVFKYNFPTVGLVYTQDIATLNCSELVEAIHGQSIDVIVGGPPCQGFSIARRVDGSNHGERVIVDSRRDLYKEYLRILAFIKPKAFVLENVLGIQTTLGGEYLNRIIIGAENLGYTISQFVVNVSDFSIPQKRKRVVLIGTKVVPFNLDYADMIAFGKNEPAMMLGEAIMDLPVLAAGEGMEVCDYDKVNRELHIKKYGTRFLEYFEIPNNGKLINHTSRPHNLRDLGDFQKLREGETSAQALRRGEVLEFPYRRDYFTDRYTRQHREKLSSTIVAHLSKDGLMFIHPTQNRSLTPREAARLQSFPDWFAFPVPRTHQFKLIGNAIPPKLAYNLGQVLNDWLGKF